MDHQIQETTTPHTPQIKSVPKPFSIEAIISDSGSKPAGPRPALPGGLFLGPMQQLYAPWLGVPAPIYLHPPTYPPIRTDSEEDNSDNSMSPKDLSKNNGKSKYA